MNRNIRIVLIILLSVIFCNGIAKGESHSESPQHSKEAEKILKRLQYTSKKNRPFLGHQDALMYGQNWWLKESDSLYEQSDVYDVCGKYPYVLGLDLGRIEKGQDRNIDRCLFRQMTAAAVKHYQRGGIVTISWHMDNPVSDSTAWDCTAGNVVRKILNEPAVKEKFLSWLDKGASFLNQLIDEKGKKIPILFRPLHECNLNGFWWSGNSCSEEEYIELWKLTFDYFVNQKQMYQLLWVYSPYNIQTTMELEKRYPGDEYVDVIGYERYQQQSTTFEMGAERFVEEVRKGIDVTVEFANQRKKIVAFTETGFCGVPYDNWWSEALGKAIEKRPIAYVHLWRNGLSQSYYFGPCSKSKSKDNFVKFCRECKIQLLKR